MGQDAKKESSFGEKVTLALISSTQCKSSNNGTEVVFKLNYNPLKAKSYLASIRSRSPQL